MVYRILWGGLVFEGGEGEADFTIEPGGVAGVVDGADTRFDRAERPSRDGDFPAVGYSTGRMGSISGLIHASSGGDFERKRSLLAALPARSPLRMTAQTPDGTFWCDVQRWGKPDVTPLVYGRSARYMVQFWSPDSRWFGDLRTFRPGDAVYHFGNATATPVVRVVGPVSAPYSVSSQGRSFTVTQSLSSGQSHRIDMASGWVYRNGVLQTGVVSSAQKFTVPPGPSVTFSGPSSSFLDVLDTSE